jgi:hypothetical protein
LENLISFILLILFFAVGVFIIYFFIDFFEYLKKYKTLIWRKVSFERPFGISQENFYLYPIRPLRFVSFMFTKDDINDHQLSIHKKRIKYSLLILSIMFLVHTFFRVFI